MLVVIVNFLFFTDGERCGKTIVDLFAKAKDPDNIVVGVIDQSYEEDLYCLESYCKEMGTFPEYFHFLYISLLLALSLKYSNELSEILSGTEIYKKPRIREDTNKVIAKPERKECPRVDQIRKLSVHNFAAKGPVWARSMVRKILGNEEFCLQIDAHTSFVADWDDKLKHEWAATGNEFGIISTVPPAIADKDSEETQNTVPRQCSVQFQEIGLPVCWLDHDLCV